MNTIGRYKIRVRPDRVKNPDGTIKVINFYLEVKDTTTKKRIQELTKRLDFTAVGDNDKDAFINAEAEKVKLQAELNENGFQPDAWRRDGLALLSMVRDSKTEATGKNYRLMEKRLISFLAEQGYRTDRLPFNLIDNFFLMKFQDSLMSRYENINTASHLYDKMAHIVNTGLRYGLIKNFISVKAIPKVPCKLKEMIDEFEAKKLWNTPCRYHEVKVALFFSIFSGLRLSDWRDLRWSHLIEKSNGDLALRKVMVKTKKLLYIYIRPDILKILGERKHDNEKVFPLLSEISYTTIYFAILDWAKDAGVAKHLSTHCGRKTFGNLLLNHSKRVEIMEKGLGHVPNTIGMTNYGEIPEVELKEATELRYFNFSFESEQQLPAVA